MKYRAASGSLVLRSECSQISGCSQNSERYYSSERYYRNEWCNPESGGLFFFLWVHKGFTLPEKSPHAYFPQGGQGQQWLYYDTFKVPESDAGTAVTLADYRGNAYTPTREKTKLHKIHISCNNVDFVRTDKRLFIDIISNVHDCT